MADSILIASTSCRYAPVPASLIALKIVQVGQNVPQAAEGDLVEGRAGEARPIVRPIEAPLNLLLDAWQALFAPLPKTLNPKPASGDMISANNFTTCPEMHIPCRSHPAVRKEGV